MTVIVYLMTANRLVTGVSGATAMALVGGSVAVSRSLVHAPLFAAQGVRYTIAAAILAALGRRRARRPRGREWAWLTAVALAGLVLFNIAVVRGVQHASPAAIGVAVALVPIALGVVGPLLEGRRPRRRVLAAAIVVTVGSCLVEGFGDAGLIGALWAAVVLCCEAGFTLLAVPVLPRHGAWGVSLHATWIGALVYVVLAIGAEGAGAIAALTVTQWAAVGYLAVMVTAVAFVLWYSSVASLGADRAGLLTGVVPASAALVGVATGASWPAALAWVGIAVVGGGLVLGMSSSRGLVRRWGRSDDSRSASHARHAHASRRQSSEQRRPRADGDRRGVLPQRAHPVDVHHAGAVIEGGSPPR
jgi:drug/metabolite transporter (DMT)-like permease